jgi:hypothetical protein
MDGPSWSIEMQVYVTSGDWEEFLAIREDLLLRTTGRLPFPDFAPEDKLALADRIDYPPEGSVSALPPVIAT